MDFLERIRVPIPEEYGVIFPDGTVRATIHNDEEVIIGHLPPKGSGESLRDRHRRKLMIPTNLYRLYFPLFYREDVVEKDPDNIPNFFESYVRPGYFLLVLGTATKTGLYPLLTDVFGAETANALMDLVLYMNWHQKTDTSDMNYQTSEEIAFSVRYHTHSWYCRHLRCSPNGAVTQEKIDEFMRRWAQLRKEAGHGDVAVHMDMTGVDCSPQTYQVRSVVTATETGGEYPCLPVAYQFVRSSPPKLSETRNALNWFRDLGLTPKRIVAGSTFPEDVLFSQCRKLHLPWLKLASKDCPGHQTMLDRHEEELMQGIGTTVKARMTLLSACEDDIPYSGPDMKCCFAVYSEREMTASNYRYFQENLERTYRDACEALENVQSPDSDIQLPVPEEKDPSADVETERAEDPVLDEDENKETDSLDEGDGDDSLEEDIPDEDEDDDGWYTEDEEEDTRTAEEQAADIVFRRIGLKNWFARPDPRFLQCLKLEYNRETGQYSVAYDEDGVKFSRRVSSYLSLVSSESRTAQEMADDFPISYLFGNVVDEPFSAMKEQLNLLPPEGADFDTWFFVCFLTDIVRALLMGPFKVFETARTGEIWAHNVRNSDELRNDKNYIPQISIDTMIAWMFEIEFSRYNTDRFSYTGCRGGIRLDVLEDVGVPFSAILRFGALINQAEDPVFVRRMRKRMRTIPVPPVPKNPGRPRGSKK